MTCVNVHTMQQEKQEKKFRLRAYKAPRVFSQDQKDKRYIDTRGYQITIET